MFFTIYEQGFAREAGRGLDDGTPAVPEFFFDPA
jgi:hypothetical protein